MSKRLFPVKVLKRQLDSSLKMVRQAIDNIPDSNWHHENGDWFYSLTTYHILETMEFYLASNPKDMNWGQRAGYDWDKVSDKRKDILPLITKELIVTYHNEIQDLLDGIYDTMTEEKFSEVDGFDRFANILEKHIYLLRHTHHHIGELAIVVREFGKSPVKWK